MSTLFDIEPDASQRQLPDLTGTAKQIPWATHVRREQFAAVDRLITEMQRLVEVHRKAGREEQAERQRAALREALDRLPELEQQTYSGWWLDRRDNTAQELLAGAEPRPGNSFGRE